GRVDADRDVEDLALVVEQPGSDAEARAPVGEPPRQVLAAGQAEVIGDEDTQAVVAGHDGWSPWADGRAGSGASSGTRWPSTTTGRPSRVTVQCRIGRSKWPRQKRPASSLAPVE